MVRAAALIVAVFMLGGCAKNIVIASPAKGASAGVVILTEQNFDAEVINSNVPVLVDFWSPYCGPCLAMNPILEEVARELAGQSVKIAKCDIGKNGAMVKKYKIKLIPHFAIFKNGKVVETKVGRMSKEELKEFISKYIKK